MMHFRKFILFLSSFLLILSASFLGQNFLDPYHSIQFLQNISVLSLLAIPLAFIFMAGGMDLSLGGVYFLALGLMRLWRESVFEKSTDYQSEILIAVGICLGFAVVGAGVGWLVAKRKQFSVLLTLAIGIFWGALGIAVIPDAGPWCEPWFCVDIFISPNTVFIIAFFVLLVGSVQSIRFYFPEMDWIKPVLALIVVTALSVFIVSEYKGLPLVTLIAVGFLVLSYFLLHQTIFGRSLVAVGENWKAAELAGVSVRRTFIFVFALMGLFVSLASLFETRSISVDNFYFAYERQLDALTAVLIGGVSFRGGFGSLSGVMMGVLFVSALNLLPAYLGFPFFVILAVKAIAILISIFFDPARKFS